MPFIRQGAAAVLLITLTLLFESAGMVALIQWGKTHFVPDLSTLSPLRSGVIVVQFTSVIIVGHTLQILLWAAFYRWNCFPSWESAVYFSVTSYSTVGYGDVVLPPRWRTLGPTESLTGVLMCGLSASFLFAVVTRLLQR